MSPWEIRYLYALYYTFITQATGKNNKNIKIILI